MKSPYFSIIIPVYNREKYIEKAISSVLQQTFTDWELIIIDDASTDSTPEIIQPHKSNEKISIIRNEINKERSASRNIGISIAKGKFICFLDSDDYFLENHLELLYNTILLNHETVAFYHSSGYIEENEILTYRYIYINPKNPVESVILNNIPVNTTCIHRNILEKEQFDTRLNINEDIYLFAKILAQYSFFSHDIPTVVWVNHEHNTRRQIKNPFHPQLLSSKYIFSDPVIKPHVSITLKRIRYHKIYIKLVHYYLKHNPVKSIFYLAIAFCILHTSSSNKYALISIFRKLFRIIR